MAPRSKPTFFICYGFSEGTMSGIRFVASLKAVGFTPESDPKRADIFIGHSGGCLLAPPGCKAKLAVYIGIPYWPGKSLVKTLVKKNVDEFKLSRASNERKAWRNKFFWHSVYFMRIDRSIAMLKAMNPGPKNMPGAQTLWIRNREDSFCSEDIWKLPATKGASFVSLPGSHDDLWVHPDVYAGIIKAYYGANVLAPTKAK